MIKQGSVPLPATTHLQHPHHQSHQLPVVLSLWLYLVRSAERWVGEDERGGLCRYVSHLGDEQGPGKVGLWCCSAGVLGLVTRGKAVNSGRAWRFR